MKNRQVYKISTLLAALGLTMMYGASLYIQPEKVEIEDIKASWSGRKVIVDGTAASVDRGAGHLFLELEDDNSTISVVQFSTENNPAQGSRLEIEGKIGVHNGELQVQASSVKVQK